MGSPGGPPHGGDKPPGKFKFKTFGHRVGDLKEAAEVAEGKGLYWEYVLVTYKELDGGDD